MSSLPKILAITNIIKSRFFRIESVHLRFSNGEERNYDRIKTWSKGSVMIVPMQDDDTVLLIREYGLGLEQYFLGFPKGAIHEDEDASGTAHRELQEEISFSADSLSRLTELSASPGYLSAKMEIFVAKGLYFSKLPGDEPEPLEVIPWSLHDVDALLKHPEFIEARSIAALLIVERQWRAKRA